SESSRGRDEKGPGHRPGPCPARGLAARLADLVHPDRRSRRRRELRVALLAAEVVGDVPVLRMPAHFAATLDVLRLVSIAVLRAQQAADHRAADRGCVVAATAADLVAEDSADHRSGDGAAHIAIVGGDIPALDPAALLAGAIDGAHRGDVGFIEPLAFALAIVVGVA